MTSWRYVTLGTESIRLGTLNCHRTPDWDFASWLPALVPLREGGPRISREGWSPPRLRPLPCLERGPAWNAGSSHRRKPVYRAPSSRSWSRESLQQELRRCRLRATTRYPIRQIVEKGGTRAITATVLQGPPMKQRTRTTASAPAAFRPPGSTIQTDDLRSVWLRPIASASIDSAGTKEACSATWALAHPTNLRQSAHCPSKITIGSSIPNSGRVTELSVSYNPEVFRANRISGLTTFAYRKRAPAEISPRESASPTEDTAWSLSTAEDMIE